MLPPHQGTAQIVSETVPLLVGVLEQVLGDALVAVYLHGSAVQGGLRPDSDVDLMVLTSRSMEDRERRALVGELLEVSGRGATAPPGRPVEVTGVVVGELDPWRYPPTRDFQYGEWLRDEYVAGAVPGPTPDPDLAVLVAAAREHAVPLLGPAPETLLPRVPVRDLCRAVVDSLPGLLADLEGDERNVVLTLARMWVTAGSGEVVPKDVAAQRMLDAVPRELRGVLDLARAAYLGERVDDWTDRAGSAAAFARYAARMVKDRTLRSCGHFGGHTGV
ncbi:MAG TPA: aminoglycoside adenylyltransferase family protein [Nocardioidaceae bacterium]